MTKLINLQMERMKYLRAIQKYIESSLIKSDEKAIEREMWKIAEENRILLKANSPTFFYDGRWWPVKKPNRAKECNKFLHPSLYVKVQEVLNKTNHKVNTLQFGVKTMIGNFLATAGHTEDLIRLFPEAVYTLLPSINPVLFNIADPLPEEKIQELLSNNEINLKYLKKLLMTQLLLAKRNQG